ncbi:uncharacterized protein H6S33_010371 [Morchella sextelata]|uniref:uncharacterized protein n=1 Tax=Morchella sextelata TaxID=1174677 RepID=UPI001D03F567|nr:uncharacterized protein H6S33_010371 [Morchella sextelata]KAH0612319.1 hypothetical protein H6S33_010371 [Morchella sextelata]
MKTFAALALSFSSLMATVSAHGYIVSPPRRAPGAEMSAVCGSTIYNNQASDNAGPIQLLMQSASSIVDIDACNLWLCKGYQFADNTDQVQSYTLGQTIDMEVKIAAPHTGYANVSIVDTKTNTIKGSELKSWDVYASTATGVTADETNFSITIPTDLTGCTTAGECVIQWFWYAPPSVDQTYEGCVDFVISDGTAATTSAAATTTAAATTSAATVETTSAAVETTSAAVETTSAAVETTSAAVEVPTTSAAPVETTSTAVEVPTTSAAPVESTSATTKAPAETTSTAVIATSSTAVVVPTTSVAVPTTLVTKTRSKTSTHVPVTKTSTSSSAPAATTSAAASTGCSKTSVEYNKCLDAANVCIRNAQSSTGGAVDFSACVAQRAACAMC